MGFAVVEVVLGWGAERVVGVVKLVWGCNHEGFMWQRGGCGSPLQLKE